MQISRIKQEEILGEHYYFFFQRQQNWHLNDENGDGLADSIPGVPGSRLAPDGKHYIPHKDGFMEVEPLEAEQEIDPNV